MSQSMLKRMVQGRLKSILQPRLPQHYSHKIQGVALGAL